MEDCYDKIAERFGGYHAPYVSIIEGKAGERMFEEKVKENIGQKKVLDVGCADGGFTLRIAYFAKQIVGIDRSSPMINRAKKNLRESEQTNVEFIKADADDLPCSKSSFDAVISRRGPVSGNSFLTKEAVWLLKPGGAMFEITIGERDMIELIEIFGRGQGFGAKKKVKETVAEVAREAGLKITFLKEFVFKEYFPTRKDLVTFLLGSPVIEDFNQKKDAPLLEKTEECCRVPKGFKFTRHRVVMFTKIS